jgi:uncharacterized OB-fold protein
VSARVVHEGLVEHRADGGIRLVGGYSPSAGRWHFPLLDTCPYTGARDVERVSLSPDATLWAWTAVTAAPPGYRGAVPFGFGVVELVAERLRVVTRLTEADPTRLAFGDPMVLVADVLHTDDDGVDVVTWAFAPVAR